jgi:hypothetical protein
MGTLIANNPSNISLKDFSGVVEDFAELRMRSMSGTRLKYALIESSYNKCDLPSNFESFIKVQTFL